jgi:outer membrane cobalamin receptor
MGPVSAGEKRSATGDTLVTYRFEEVVVYGRRSPQPPSMITEIDTAILRARNGFDVANILREDPGLHVSTGTKGDTKTGIRGFDAADVLVLVDGYPVNTGYYGKVDLSMIPAENIERIKVIKGPASAAYGANGMGGVINIITRSSFDKPLTGVTAEGGGQGFYRVNVNHGRSIGRYNYYLFAYHRQADGFRLSDSFSPTPREEGGIRDNSQYSKTGVSGKIGLKYSERVRLGLGLGVHLAERGCPSTVSSLEPPRYSEFPEWKRFNLNVNGDFDISRSAMLKTVIFVNSQADRYINYGSSEMSMDDLIYDSMLENWTVGGSVKLYLDPAPDRQLKTGITFRRDLMNKKPDADEPWYSHYNYTSTFFSEIAYMPWRRTSLTAGVGVNIFSSEGLSEIRSYLSPMVSVSQSLPWSFRIYGSWANSIRFPTMHQLYSTTSGNELLRPEEADKLEFGLERSFFRYIPGSGAVQLVWFDNSLKDLIYRASRTYVYENIKDTSLRGMEARISWKITEHIGLRSGYSMMDMAASSGELLQEIPGERFSLELFGSTAFGTRVHCSFNRYQSISTYIESLSLPDYDICNVSLSQELAYGFRLTLRANNILDENYQEELGYPGPGRQLMGGFSWRR